MPLFIGQDENLTCKDCGQPFVFTQGEQKFFDEQGFTDKPKRCKPCRIAKKAAKAAQQGGYDQQPRFPSDSNYPPQNYGNSYGNGNGNGNGRPSRGNGNRRGGDWEDNRRRRNHDDY